MNDAARRRLSANDGKFDLDEREFRRIASIVRRHSGIALSTGKESLVYSRLAKRLRSLQLSSFADYCDLIESSAGEQEIPNLVRAITTNVTAFYRESHHFEHFAAKVAPRLVARAHQGEEIRIWSAGCSSGPEPYTIALCLLQCDPNIDARDVLILGTDIDSAVLERASEGRYSAEDLRSVPDDLKSGYFHRVEQSRDQLFEIDARVKRMMRFRELNLHESWPFSKTFATAFCRNVLIYFEADDQSRILTRMIDCIEPGGWFYIGHSERISGVNATRALHRGPTIYQKAAS